jgi:putative glycosyltransferase
MQLSIVTTLYYSAPYLKEFYTRICAAAEKITNNYEIILVNDGSPDASLHMAIALYENDPRVKVIDLSRNFGHHKAAMTGLAHASGDLVFSIDVDLEEDPELLNSFYDTFKHADADVVYGVQSKRKGGVWERVTGAVFYWLFNLLSTAKIPRNLLMSRLMSQRYVRSLIAHKESELDISGLWFITGFKQIPVKVAKHSKKDTTYTLSKKAMLMVRSITGFSNKPLLYIAVLGAAILAMTTILSLYILGVRIFVGTPPSGYLSIILSIWFLGGLIIFSIGVVAIYLSVIFTETKNRPYTIIRQIYESNSRST